MTLADPFLLRMESFPPQEPDAVGALMAVSGSDPAILLDILRPSVGLAVWPRNVDECWREAAAAVAAQPWEQVRVAGAPETIAAQFTHGMASRLPRWLEEDIAWLSSLLAVLTATSKVSATLTRTRPRDDAPPSSLRLSCRYGGPSLCWWHAPATRACMASGTIEPFAVAVVKGAARPALRRRAIRLDDAPPLDHPDGSIEGPTLLIEPARSACSSTSPRD